MHTSLTYGIPTVLCILALSVASPALSESVMTGGLPRGADLGFRVEATEGTLHVSALEPGSPAASAGLENGDVIVAVAGNRFEKAFVGQDLLRRLDGDRAAALTVRREDGEEVIIFTPPPRPLEDLEGVDSIYGVVETPDGALTYFERMFQFDRIGFERGKLDPREIQERMIRHARFHHEYLLEKKTPEASIAEHPDLADVWKNIRGAGDGVHYGRPFAFHHQAAGRDFLQAWIEIDAPALALFNGFDQFEYPHGHRLITDTLNRLRPGSARHVELPDMGHSYYIYPTIKDAVARRNRTPSPELAITPILDWLQEVAGI